MNTFALTAFTTGDYLAGAAIGVATAILVRLAISPGLKDVCDLDIPDSTFDTIVTVFTFCSVPRPIVGLRELHRVLKSSGQLLMIEHVRSAFGPLGVMKDLLTPLSRRFGPELNRDTVGNVQKAGFRLRRVENAYLDVVKVIDAVKSDDAAN